MSVAGGTAQLFTQHAGAGVGMRTQLRRRRWRMEAGPTRARIKLGGGIEQQRIATGAVIAACRLGIPVATTEGNFCASLAADAIGVGIKALTPLIITELPVNAFLSVIHANHYITHTTLERGSKGTLYSWSKSPVSGVLKADDPRRNLQFPAAGE